MTTKLLSTLPLSAKNTLPFIFPVSIVDLSALIKIFTLRKHEQHLKKYIIRMAPRPCRQELLIEQHFQKYIQMDHYQQILHKDENNKVCQNLIH